MTLYIMLTKRVVPCFIIQWFGIYDMMVYGRLVLFSEGHMMNKQTQHFDYATIVLKQRRGSTFWRDIISYDKKLFPILKERHNVRITNTGSDIELHLRGTL